MCLCIISGGCSSGEKGETNLSDYYLPLEELGEAGWTYIYRHVTDSLADREVWLHRQTAPGQIESINYDYQEEIVQRQYDRMISNGIVTDSLILYFTDSLGQKVEEKVTIGTPHRFPFVPGDSTQVWLTQLEWWQPGDSLHVVLERRRRCIGDTLWTYDGQSLPAVLFRTEDTFETERDGWTSSAWSGEEVYAKGIGLVYYRRQISPTLSLEFSLEQIKK